MVSSIAVRCAAGYSTNVGRFLSLCLGRQAVGWPNVRVKAIKVKAGCERGMIHDRPSVGAMQNAETRYAGVVELRAERDVPLVLSWPKYAISTLTLIVPNCKDVVCSPIFH